jgi:hypothetical protein
MGSDLGEETGYPDEGFSWFSSDPVGKECRMVPDSILELQMTRVPKYTKYKEFCGSDACQICTCVPLFYISFK